MHWTTVLGRTIEFPTKTWADLNRAEKLSRDDVMDALRKSQDVWDAARELDQRVQELQEEASRLRHENEFMLRLINQQLDATNGR